MRTESPRSAGAIYLDKAERIEALRQAARRARVRMPAIRRILLYGSLVRGTPTPRSDADMLIEVESSPHPQPRDRIPEALGALSPHPSPIDLLVLTTAEIDRLRREGSRQIESILAVGLDLAA